MEAPLSLIFRVAYGGGPVKNSRELELELIKSHMAQKPVLRGEVNEADDRPAKNACTRQRAPLVVLLYPAPGFAPPGISSWLDLTNQPSLRGAYVTATASKGLVKGVCALSCLRTRDSRPHGDL